ncbi:MAG: hypothetical protein H8E19_00815 [Deltaproteobacteria bacterium]|uniref:Uncharacterized protein n=1 Tax=Candidatus Desulfacyla euxinica TaxID=2841693 RepID=A0A8J6MXW6_9DELT|nr:hypothetical protein [Candidatus Desulfacyla euxinica]
MVAGRSKAEIPQHAGSSSIQYRESSTQPATQPVSKYPIPNTLSVRQYLVRNYRNPGEKEQKMRPASVTLELDPQKIAQRKEKAQIV